MRRLGVGFGRKGFALPTVLIASIVLLTVLAVAVSATTAVRTVLVNQYYAQLAQVAGEAGTAYAKSCLAANGNVPQWTDAKPLTPATDCSGNSLLVNGSAPTIQVLVVAGGASGGTSAGGAGGAGGGGAGGLLYNASYSVTNGQSIPVTVGNGGAAVTGSSISGNNGQNSVFGSLTAIGGGRGSRSNPGNTAAVGGSGGGGGFTSYSGTSSGAAGTAGQGNSGGASVSNNNGGGGGGAGGAGGSTNPAYNGIAGGTGGAGGVGLAYSISGSSVTYSTGGEGATWPSGILQNGAANTGNGGSASTYSAATTSGAGGSGIVIVSYPTGSLTATGGTITTSGGNTINTFTSGGTFNITSFGTVSCPSDPRCSVTVNGDVRSSFKVGMPTLDADGKAVSIPNTGYVEVIRTSNGSVWRTYNQPSVQAAVVPDLCSGAATSGLGWNNAVRAATQDNFNPTSSAQTITSINSPVNAGYTWFRKDFAVSDPGSYSVNALTPTNSQAVDMYVDGTDITTADGALSSADTTLTAGCHTVVARLTNQTVAQQAIRFTASIQKDGKTIPVVSTDSSWRVTAGDTEHYSQPLYYADPSVWTPVRLYSSSAGFGGDPSAGYITTTHSYTGTTTYPASSYAFFRDNRIITVSTPTQVSVNTGCDDSCVVYLDGEQIENGNISIASTTTVTLQPGSHEFGVRLFNNAAGMSDFWFAVLRTSDNAVLSQSDANWSAANFWTTAANQEYYSYDSTYLPSPSPFPSAAVSVLVVGGGGGGGGEMGGGGGGGGVVYNAAYQVSTPINVTVGAGGAGAPAGDAQRAGLSGGNSTFGSITAFGGGGGGSDYAINTTPPWSGGSGGGTAGCLQTTPAIGIVGQGNKGGAYTGACGPYYPGGGGGAGGAGTFNPGTGGVGVSNSILGTPYYWGGGGGGSGYTGIGGNGGAGGGGGGAIGVTTGGSGINPGSPGTNGALVAQSNVPGGNGGPFTGGGGGGGSHYNSNNYGGNGGSGVVIVSFPVGSMTVSLSGSYQDWSAGTPGYSTYLFYGAGTFRIVSVP